MSAETRSTYQPTSTDKHVGRHSVDTSPPLGRYFTNTPTTLRTLGQLLLLSSIFSTRLRRAFSGRRPFLAFKSGNVHVFFPAMFFSSSLLLYTTLVTFGSSAIWGLLLSEVRYFKGTKVGTKSWYDYALFLPHGWVFFSSRSSDISQLFVA